MDRLETVAHVRERTTDDDRHRIVEEGRLHFLLNLDDRDVIGLIVSMSVSMGGTSLMIQPLRSPGSGLRGIGDDEVLALFDVVAHEDRHDLIGDRRLPTDLQQGTAGDVHVVSRNSSQSISPRPFNRWKSLV